MIGAAKISSHEYHFLSIWRRIYDCTNFSLSFRKRKSVVYINVVFHAPDHHVITVKLHRFILTSTFCRLNFSALRIFTRLFDGVWLNSISTFFFQFMYWAVRQPDFKNSEYGHENIKFPPKSPAQGQISTIQSDASMNSSLCSTTMMVFHISFSLRMAWIVLSISFLSSQIVGSSST